MRAIAGSGVGPRMRRALRKPPSVVAARALAELSAELDRVRAPRRARRLDEATLLRATAARSLDELWERVRTRTLFVPIDAAALEQLAPGERARVLAAADAAVERRVSLLGSPETRLGVPVDWHADFVAGVRWPAAYWRSISYVDPADASDVKMPWELSRLQWALPAGQAYALTGDERYAVAVRDLLVEWLDANPYASSVNWAVTMEAALRILTWSWLLGALGGSEAWSDDEFRLRLLRGLYLHGDFTARNLERSDVNGNHYTADAVGLHAAGLLLGVDRWAQRGWRILEDELPRQVHPDGVDFESSTAYHRLVAELFLLAALQRERLGLAVDERYRERVRAMAAFTAAYTRPDGSAPHWGDADDARALPLGGAAPDDHRHLIGAVAGAWHDDALASRFSGSVAETTWLLGVEAGRLLPSAAAPPESRAFREGGVFVLADGPDHVFVDCGPVGLAGRGGHGHNDCLSFEAFLSGVPLVADPGSYVYTASFEWRNRFRSTAAHNTPRIDRAEQADFDPRLLWTLGPDAVPELREWSPQRFVGAHHGYRRLPVPVTPVRTIELHPEEHRLVVLDDFEGEGDHEVAVPLQFVAGARVRLVDAGAADADAGDASFRITWSDADAWSVRLEEGWVSPSYGVRLSAPRLEWRRTGSLVPLRVEVRPR